MAFNPFSMISKSPTNPKPERKSIAFDVNELFDGPVEGADTVLDTRAGLDEKLRQAYFWIINHAIISPHYDIEYNDAPPAEFDVGDNGSRITLPSAQSYSSYALLPLLVDMYGLSGHFL